MLRNQYTANLALKAIVVIGLRIAGKEMSSYGIRIHINQAVVVSLTL